MRNTKDTLGWYAANETKSQIGFDPDGMCLKICRTARGIGAVYPSALSAQQATPEKYRVHKVEDLRKGMVLYYDDPRDSNPYGHIVTMVGRAKGGDKSSLSDIFVRTNSVRRDEIVVVRGDYFPRYWGDTFQFGATWLNGQEIPDFHKEKEPQPPLTSARNLKAAIDDLQKAVAWHKKHGNDRVVKALRRDIAAIRQTIKKFS